MDIKNSPTQYAATVGLADFDLKPVQESIDILQNGAVPFEFRTTVVRGLHDENSLDVYKRQGYLIPPRVARCVYRPVSSGRNAF